MKATHTAWALSSDYFAIRLGSESTGKLVGMYDDCTNVLTLNGTDDVHSGSVNCGSVRCGSLEEAMEIIGNMN